MLDVMRMKDFVHQDKLDNLLEKVFNENEHVNFSLFDEKYSTEVNELLQQVDCHELFIFTSLDKYDEADPIGDYIEIVLDEQSNITPISEQEYVVPSCKHCENINLCFGCESRIFKQYEEEYLSSIFFDWSYDQIDNFTVSYNEIMSQICDKYGLIEEEVKICDDVFDFNNYNLENLCDEKITLTLNIFKRERDFAEEYEKWLNSLTIDDMW